MKCRWMPCLTIEGPNWRVRITKKNHYRHISAYEKPLSCKKCFQNTLFTPAHNNLNLFVVFLQMKKLSADLHNNDFYSLPYTVLKKLLQKVISQMCVFFLLNSVSSEGLFLCIFFSDNMLSAAFLQYRRLLTLEGEIL